MDQLNRWRIPGKYLNELKLEAYCDVNQYSFKQLSQLEIALEMMNDLGLANGIPVGAISCICHVLELSAQPTVHTFRNDKHTWSVLCQTAEFSLETILDRKTMNAQEHCFGVFDTCARHSAVNIETTDILLIEEFRLFVLQRSLPRAAATHTRQQW